MTDTNSGSPDAFITQDSIAREILGSSRGLREFDEELVFADARLSDAPLSPLLAARLEENEAELTETTDIFLEAMGFPGDISVVDDIVGNTLSVDEAQVQARVLASASLTFRLPRVFRAVGNIDDYFSGVRERLLADFPAMSFSTDPSSIAWIIQGLASLATQEEDNLACEIEASPFECGYRIADRDVPLEGGPLSATALELQASVAWNQLGKELALYRRQGGSLDFVRQGLNLARGRQHSSGVMSLLYSSRPLLEAESDNEWRQINYTTLGRCAAVSLGHL